MFCLKAINGLFDDFLAQAVESYQGEIRRVDEDAFIHCGRRLLGGGLLRTTRGTRTSTMATRTTTTKTTPGGLGV